MAHHEVEAQWMGKMKFNALVGGHTVTMDAPKRVGGEDEGSIPKPFIITALSGCTGMDVVAILRKQEIELDSLDLHIHGELSKQIPLEYVSIHVRYDLKGAAEHQAAAQAAIMRSQNEICGVSSMLKKAMPVTWETIYNGQTIFNNQPQPTEV